MVVCLNRVSWWWYRRVNRGDLNKKQGERKFTSNCTIMIAVLYRLLQLFQLVCSNSNSSDTSRPHFTQKKKESLPHNVASRPRDSLVAPRVAERCQWRNLWTTKPLAHTPKNCLPTCKMNHSIQLAVHPFILNTKFIQQIRGLRCWSPVTNKKSKQQS